MVGNRARSFEGSKIKGCFQKTVGQHSRGFRLVYKVNDTLHRLKFLFFTP